MQPLKQATKDFTLSSKVHPWRGVTVVIALHALLFFAFYTGLGEKIIQSKPLVVMAQLVSEPPPQQQPEPVFKEPEKLEDKDWVNYSTQKGLDYV